MDAIPELQKEANIWNLGSDKKLLDALQKFSSQIQDHTKNIVDKVENLNTATVDTHCRLRNTFNEFLLLANSQFVENVRVTHE